MAFLCYRLRWIKSENLNFSIAASRTPPGYLDFGQAMAEHVTANLNHAVFFASGTYLIIFPRSLGGTHFPLLRKVLGI